MLRIGRGMLCVRVGSEEAARLKLRPVADKSSNNAPQQDGVSSSCRSYLRRVRCERSQPSPDDSRGQTLPPPLATPPRASNGMAKKLVIFKGTDHNDLLDRNGVELRDTIRDLIQQTRKDTVKERSP